MDYRPFCVFARRRVYEIAVLDSHGQLPNCMPEIYSRGLQPYGVRHQDIPEP